MFIRAQPLTSWRSPWDPSSPTAAAGGTVAGIRWGGGSGGQRLGRGFPRPPRSPLERASRGSGFVAAPLWGCPL